MAASEGRKPSSLSALSLLADPSKRACLQAVNSVDSGFAKVFIVVAITFRLRRLLAVLGFILCGELSFLLRMANEALGIRSVVLFAPVALDLEVSNKFCVATGAHFFGNAVLVAPPAVVVVASFGNVSVGRAPRMAATDKGTYGDGAQQD
jgi:hypothetical protein